ncbi:MAG: hypothetical protein HOP13_08560 [Alphaproteobacteria bacterium]|nr:hypothetical protein [Alphaproteobacteria bacterium]
MKKKPLPGRRPQEAMARFDRLLASMAPKAEPPTAVAPKRASKKKPTPRRKAAK